MYIVNHRTFFFWFTGILLAAAIGAIAVFGLPLSIDFTGGSLVEVSYPQGRPAIDVVKQELAGISMSEVSVRESGAQGITLRTKTLTPDEHQAVLGALSQGGTVAMTESQFTSIGPSLGEELGTKALWAIAAVILAIVLYIAWAFRRVSKPVSSWVYGVTVIVILIHDVLVPTGFYAALAHLHGLQVDPLFVVAILAILGYSVNDTIVIFDRVREHLSINEKTHAKQPFDHVVGAAITETMGRSINTSLTVVLALLALAFIGSPVTFNFALVLLVGVVAGTYSSILLAAPLLVPMARWFAKDAVISGAKK